MGLSLEHLGYISRYLADRPCSMCGALGRTNFTLEQRRGCKWLFGFICKCCGYEAIADLMSQCPDCHDEYVKLGPDGCERCNNTGLVKYYDILRWEAKAKYEGEAIKRVAAFSRLQHEQAYREWANDWPTR